jgi:hypothetical protein
MTMNPMTLGTTFSEVAAAAAVAAAAVVVAAVADCWMKRKRKMRCLSLWRQSRWWGG